MFYSSFSERRSYVWIPACLMRHSAQARRRAGNDKKCQSSAHQADIRAVQDANQGEQFACGFEIHFDFVFQTFF